MTLNFDLFGNREPQTHFAHGEGVISGGISKYIYLLQQMYEVFINVFNIIIILSLFCIYKLPEHECCLINHNDEYVHVGLLVFIPL